MARVPGFGHIEGINDDGMPFVFTTRQHTVLEHAVSRQPHCLCVVVPVCVLSCDGCAVCASCDPHTLLTHSLLSPSVYHAVYDAV